MFKKYRRKLIKKIKVVIEYTIAAIEKEKQKK